MLSNQFGVYKAYGYKNVTATAVWKASQTSTASEAYFASQVDRNLVVYTVVNNSGLWSSNTYNGGNGAPFCLDMLDTGILTYVDSSESTIWKTNIGSN